MPAALYELAWPQLALLSAGLAFLTTTAWVLFPGPLKTERVRLGIVSLELARSSWKAREILDSWREARMLGRASRNIQWDFAFIPTYTAGAAVIGIVAARLAAEAGGPRPDPRARHGRRARLGGDLRGTARRGREHRTPPPPGGRPRS